MARPGWLAGEFEQHRPHLRAVAYRILGSLSDADDAPSRTLGCGLAALTLARCRASAHG
jgi:DNA-directed RNA polymerase specialized sigma24 family protein